jgi:YD repeat-containing protein
MGGVKSFAYDNADRVDQVILPSGRTYGFGFDANGNRTSITMPSGAVQDWGTTRSTATTRTCPEYPGVRYRLQPGSGVDEDDDSLWTSN